MGGSSFTTVPLDLQPHDVPCLDLGPECFHLPQPTRHGLSGMASISSAFQRHQQQRHAKPVALFSIAKATIAPAAADPSMPRHDFRIVKVKPDGRCMFRAIAASLSYNQGFVIAGSQEEEEDADDLRMAAADALCRSSSRRKEFKDAAYAVETESPLPAYCARMRQESFWGGNPELLILSKLLQVPITVFLSQTESKAGGGGFVPIAAYGQEYERKPISLLYRDGNHYDALFPA